MSVYLDWRSVLRLLAISVFIVAALASLSVAAGEWTTYQGDDRATGFLDADAVEENVSEKWRYESELGMISSPAVTEDAVYVGKLSGSNLWEFSPERRDLSVEANTTGELVSIDRASGEQGWSVDTNGSVAWSSPAVEDGSVYVGSLAGTVYSVDEGSGDVEWEFDVDEMFFASPRVVDDVVYIGARDFSGHSFSHEDYHMYALDADEGDLIWKYPVPEGVFGAAAVVDDEIYFGGQNGSVYRVDADSGDLEWEFETDELPEESSMWRRNSAGAQTGGVASGPTVVDDVVYFGSYAGYVYAVDRESGEENWSYHVDAPFVTSPAVHDGTVYIGGYDTNLHALDADSGELEWRYSGEWEMAKSSPIVVDDTVYTGSIDGYVYAVDADSGAERWTYETGTYVDSSPAYHDGALYFTSFEALHAFEEDSNGERPTGLEYGSGDEPGEEAGASAGETTDGETSSDERPEPSWYSIPDLDLPGQTLFVVVFAAAWLMLMAAAVKRY